MNEKEYLNEGSKLYSHQISILDKYHKSGSKNFGLFLDMGLGKTLTSLSMACEIYDMGLIDKVLIVPPVSLIATWREQIDSHIKEEYKHIFLDFHPHSILSRGKGLNEDARTLLIIDECHNFKNLQSKRTKLVLKSYKKFYGVLLLSGSPMTRSAIDLYVPSKMLGLPYNKSQFTEKFCFIKIKKTRFGFEEYIPPILKDEEVYMKEMSEVSCWLKTEDVIDLPDQVFINKYFDINDKQRVLLSKIEGKMLSNSEKLDNKQLLLFIKNHLSAISLLISGFVINPETREVILVNENKLDLLMDLIESINSPVMVICQFINELKEIEKRLIESKVTYVTRYGELTKDENDKAYSDFKSGNFKVFLGTLAKNSEGLNLQEVCNNMILYTLDFDLKNYAQVLKRVHRIGSKNTVFYYNLLSSDPNDKKYKGLDFIIRKSLDSKGSGLKSIFDTYRESINELG